MIPPGMVGTLDYSSDPVSPLRRKLWFWRAWAIGATLILLVLAYVQPPSWWIEAYDVLRHPNGTSHPVTFPSQ